MTNKIVAKLNDMQQGDQRLSTGQVPLWVREATGLERRARGQATEIVQHDVPEDLAALSDGELAAEAEAIAERFRSRVRRARA